MARSCLLEVIEAQRSYQLLVESDHLLLGDVAHAQVRAPLSAPATIAFGDSDPNLDAPSGLEVNGKCVTRAQLHPGDVLSLSATQTLTYTGIDTGILKFRLQGEYGVQPAAMQGPDATGGQGRGAFYSLLLVFLIALLSLPFWVPDFATKLPAPHDREQGSQARTHGLALEQWLSSGPLHAAHSAVSVACADCHVADKSPIPNEPCFACHTMERHFSREKTADHPLCVTCHKEHNEPGNLINADARLCSQCHNDMDTVRAVLTAGTQHNLHAFQHFDGQHPEFNPRVPPGNLNFNHKHHMAADLVEGKAALACADCHTPNGAGFKPVTFTEHCADCHRLDREGKREPWVHGNLAAVLLQFQTEVDAPIDAALALTNGDTCQQCHRVKLTSLEPTALQQATARWRLAMPTLNARFSHKRHEGRLACADCHAAKTSEQADDVLLPERRQCQSCHNQKAPEPLQQCATCHQFHRVSWE
ncbi:hypothetical protein L1F30_11720 [Simiduia sp. 21SJ11W-1]|uniref:cytochrome c3 family protein n=1 Tax=Simiduia sp. 21SJ11W-1 TaxID=2909669 RepID=UPI0020A06DAF|nr:cytochrome c3 family protein [Simiduia sp. 21SJ11W-1]UTA46828.1 hypothetical protein L1F30_11720 [Simiduia sp. 21SJ11W-1]